MKRIRTHGFHYLLKRHKSIAKTRILVPDDTADQSLFHERVRRGREAASSLHRLQGESVFEAMGLGSEVIVDTSFPRELSSSEKLELGEAAIGVHQEFSVEMTPMASV